MQGSITGKATYGSVFVRFLEGGMTMNDWKWNFGNDEHAEERRQQWEDWQAAARRGQSPERPDERTAFWPANVKGWKATKGTNSNEDGE
jgi:hypothetical protein